MPTLLPATRFESIAQTSLVPARAQIQRTELRTPQATLHSVRSELAAECSAAKVGTLSSPRGNNVDSHLASGMFCCGSSREQMPCKHISLAPFTLSMYFHSLHRASHRISLYWWSQ